MVFIPILLTLLSSEYISLQAAELGVRYLLD